MPGFMYHFPSGALLGIVASMGLILLAGVSLWRSMPGRRGTAMALSAVALPLGVVEGAVSAYVLLVGAHQVAPGTAQNVLTAELLAAGVCGVLGCLMIAALIMRQQLLLTSLLAIGCMASASASQLMLQHTDVKAWALTVALLWIVTPLALVTFVATLLAGVLRYANGAQQRGYKSGLEAGYVKARAELEMRQLNDADDTDDERETVGVTT